jgi:peptidoglycan/xylan/chitin deacetylase (PgdA/CDA1 family)
MEPDDRPSAHPAVAAIGRVRHVASDHVKTGEGQIIKDISGKTAIFLATTLIATLLARGGRAQDAGRSSARPPVIILKLDDVNVSKPGAPISPRWLRTAEYIETNKLKASFGIICTSLEKGNDAYLRWIKEVHQRGAIEFWFHGYDHAVHTENGTQFNEFNGRSYEDQKERFDRSQRLARDRLGFAFHAFGPGGGVGNGLFDANTTRVMAEEPDMRIWLYPMPLDAAGKKLESQGKVVILDRVWAVNLESKPGLPDYRRLVDGYAKNRQRTYFVLQGHPNKWDDPRWDEFVKIIDFLKGQGCSFMTPTAYVESLASGRNR